MTTSGSTSILPASTRPPTDRPLRLGTRGSALALAQSGWVAHTLSELIGRTVELIPVLTPGDLVGGPVDSIGSPGVFVSSVRDALLRNEVDLVVHSFKDLPTAAPDGLFLAAVPEREDPRDALVSRDDVGLGGLPPGARIGTSSLRRQLELQRFSPALAVVPLRGNVNSRLSKVASGAVDAVVVAAAGLARIGRSSAVTEYLDPAVMLPAPGQGALAIECRADDGWMREALGQLDHEETRTAVTAEREFLATLQMGCSSPVGALATVLPDLGPGRPRTVVIEAMVALGEPRTPRRFRGRAPADDAAGLGRRLAQQALDVPTAIGPTS